MANLDGAVVGKYLALGAAAVATPMLLAKVSFLSTILASTWMTYDIMGVTVGSILMAAIGVGVIDQLAFQK